MIYHIDPKVDFSAKLILGQETNLDLTQDFLNSILHRSGPQQIHSLELLNPYNDKDSLTDKLSVVDVKCRDANGALFQIDIQLWVNRHLVHRILHNLADIYQEQLRSGEDYQLLCPTQSIWLLDDCLFLMEENSRYHHHFQLIDPADGLLLSDQLAVHIIELPKWTETQITDKVSRWLYFFRYGETLDDQNLPEGLQDPIMEKAMGVLKDIHDRNDYLRVYQSRRTAALWEATIERHNREREEAAQKAEQALAKAEQDLAQAEQALTKAEQEKEKAEQKAKRMETEAGQKTQQVEAENLRLREKLIALGIDPNS